MDPFISPAQCDMIGLRVQAQPQLYVVCALRHYSWKRRRQICSNTRFRSLFVFEAFSTWHFPSPVPVRCTRLLSASSCSAAACILVFNLPLRYIRGRLSRDSQINRNLPGNKSAPQGWRLKHLKMVFSFIGRTLFPTNSKPRLVQEKTIQKHGNFLFLR